MAKGTKALDGPFEVDGTYPVAVVMPSLSISPDYEVAKAFHAGTYDVHGVAHLRYGATAAEAEARLRADMVDVRSKP